MHEEEKKEAALQLYEDIFSKEENIMAFEAAGLFKKLSTIHDKEEIRFIAEILKILATQKNV